MGDVGPDQFSTPFQIPETTFRDSHPPDNRRLHGFPQSVAVVL